MILARALQNLFGTSLADKLTREPAKAGQRDLALVALPFFWAKLVEKITEDDDVPPDYKPHVKWKASTLRGYQGDDGQFKSCLTNERVTWMTPILLPHGGFDEKEEFDTGNDGAQVLSARSLLTSRRGCDAGRVSVSPHGALPCVSQSAALAAR